MADHRILYCNCTYAKIVAPEVKEAVLRKLSDSGVAFDAVADLCEMSARRDPAMQRLAKEGKVKIAACYPRAVKWLFGAAKADLDPGQTEIINMRVSTPEEASEALLSAELSPNIPSKDSTPADAPDKIEKDSPASS